MPVTKSQAESQMKSHIKPAKPIEKNKSASNTAAARLDILFSGPMLLVPSVIDGKIIDVEVYSPNNGHPVGAVFLPGILFTDAELDDPQCERWPDAETFSLLDPHSYSVDLKQERPKGTRSSGFAASSIPDTNHKVKPGRRIGGPWHVSVSVKGQLADWSSHRLLDVAGGFFQGADAPTSAQVAITHRLTYTDVTSADFYGATQEPRDYLSANIAQGGTLIVLGEVPYQSTLLHEREAVSAIAKLAGLDLHLIASGPIANRARPLGHIKPCVYSIIVV